MQVTADLVASNKLAIRAYQNADQKDVIALWQETGLTAPQNNPVADIKRKLKVNPELFLVGLIGKKVVASVMGGYEGHRGWVNYLCVSKSAQGCGYARAIMQVLEDLLRAKGCPKINLQIRSTNDQVCSFYNALGYQSDEVISLGKRLD